MLKKKYSVLTILLLVGMLILSACSGGGSEEGSKDNGSKKGDVKELTFMFRGQPIEEEAYKKAIEQFEADNPGVKVNMTVTAADQYDTKLTAAITGNQVPDVFYIGAGDIRSYVGSNILLDLTEYIESSDAVDLDNLWEYGVESYRFDGETVGVGNIYALPKDVGPFGFGYNKTMFEEAGVELPDPDVPYTWDEFIEVNQELTDPENEKFGTGLNVNVALYAFVWSNGGDWLDETQTQVTVDTPEFAEALQFFADMQNEYEITPSIEQGQTLDTYQRWLRGQLAFFPVAPWDLGTFDTELEFEYDMIPWPVGSTGEPATYTGTMGIAASADTEYPDLAAELVIYLTASEEGQQMLVDERIQIPNLKDMAEEWVADDSIEPANKQEFINIVEESGRHVPPDLTYNGEWFDYFFTNIQPVLDGEQTAADYVAEVQPRMQEYLDNAIELEEQSKQ